ncbi:hypothetical protein J7I44_14770 [Frateuria sp. MAH-13]|uniref:Lipoprotein n=1 Tax=Frateuria flava TaxID=2821489 RepID=A0ABS4DR94_9GAMM|nr:hypothetical protein [Frateuria flava]MBP1475575.1 hypothetical protein [Frateuria flava]
MVASPMEKRALASIPGNKRLSYAIAGVAPFGISVSAPDQSAARRRGAAMRRCAVAVLVAGLAVLPAACSSPMDDIKLNPHPAQRYELIATVDAPGEFDSVEGYLSYEVTNVECVPKNPIEGARNVPNTSRRFALTRVDAHTWKGSFYRDLLQDEDYFGLGVCHWDVTNASPVFRVHAASFSPAFVLADPIEVTLTRYFKRSDYFNQALRNVGALGFSSTDAEVGKAVQSFFPITVTIKRSRS